MKKEGHPLPKHEAWPENGLGDGVSLFSYSNYCNNYTRKKW